MKKLLDSLLVFWEWSVGLEQCSGYPRSGHLKEKIMKKLIGSLIVSLSMFGQANAMCPDITGEWVATFDSAVLGEAYVGLYKLTITNSQIIASGNFSYLGVKEFDSFQSGYTYTNSCKVNFKLDGVTTFNGFAVSPDKIRFIASDTELGASFSLVAERFNPGP